MLTQELLQRATVQVGVFVDRKIISHAIQKSVLYKTKGHKESDVQWKGIKKY